MYSSVISSQLLPSFLRAERIVDRSVGRFLILSFVLPLRFRGSFVLKVRARTPDLTLAGLWLPARTGEIGIEHWTLSVTVLVSYSQYEESNNSDLTQLLFLAYFRLNSASPGSINFCFSRPIQSVATSTEQPQWGQTCFEQDCAAKNRTARPIIPSRYIAPCKARTAPRFPGVEYQRICSPGC